MQPAEPEAELSNSNEFLKEHLWLMQRRVDMLQLELEKKEGLIALIERERKDLEEHVEQVETTRAGRLELSRIAQEQRNAAMAQDFAILESDGIKCFDLETDSAFDGRKSVLLEGGRKSVLVGPGSALAGTGKSTGTVNNAVEGRKSISSVRDMQQCVLSREVESLKKELEEERRRHKAEMQSKEAALNEAVQNAEHCLRELEINIENT